MSTDHGHTVAAWTGVTIIMIAFLVGAVGVVLAQPNTFWVGIGLIPTGLVIGKVLQLMGLGAKRS